ncbi:MAG TPA: phosphatase PAP2 family protein [Lentimicrobium sp.]|nr:phosphatase PAP2 family protein [Lentimicrobium sp.]
MQTAISNKQDDIRWIATFACIIYLIIIYLISGLKPENWAIASGYSLLIWITPGTRRFALAFAIFIIFGVSYDLMKNWPNYLFNEVDISGIYHLEKSIFGFSVGNITLTLNEYFALNYNIYLDFVCGLIYLNWVPIPLAYAAYLYFKKRGKFIDYGLAFLFVNFIGFAVYYIHPAAPPWYVENYGFDLQTGIGGSAAGLARFDELIGLPVFTNIYTRNTNVFAALPSLHCAYPVVMLYFGLKISTGRFRPAIISLMALFMVGIWFSAVYSGHHYIVDVILGVICAIAGLLFYEKLLLKTGWFLRFRTNYNGLIK